MDHFKEPRKFEALSKSNVKIGTKVVDRATLETVGLKYCLVGEIMGYSTNIGGKNVDDVKVRWSSHFDAKSPIYKPGNLMVVTSVAGFNDNNPNSAFKAVEEGEDLL